VVVQGLDLYRCSQPVFVRLARRSGSKGTGDLIPANRPTGSIDGVTIERVRALGTHNATKASCSISGIPGERVRNVRLKDCYIEMPGGLSKVPGQPPEREKDYPQSNLFGETPAYAFFVRHADGIVLENVTTGYLKNDVRQWLVKEDAGVETVNCRGLDQIQPVPIPKD
jgi:hypothetical protein